MCLFLWHKVTKWKLTPVPLNTASAFKAGWGFDQSLKLCPKPLD